MAEGVSNQTKPKTFFWWGKIHSSCGW